MKAGTCHEMSGAARGSSPVAWHPICSGLRVDSLVFRVQGLCCV